MTAVSAFSPDATLARYGFVPFMTVPAPAWVEGSSTDAPSARTGHSAVWTGEELVIWGGNLGPGLYSASGGLYAPGQDQWQLISSINAPQARSLHTAVWTGSEMLIWGGFTPTGYLNSGARWLPNPQTWTALPTLNAPQGRDGPVALWTGNRLIVWSGRNSGGLLADGALYDPVSNQWSALTLPGAPSARFGARAVWTGTRAIIWGGEGESGPLDSGAQLIFDDQGSPSEWRALNVSGAPSARSGQAAVWTGQKLIVWGGRRSGEFLGDGAAYDPVADSWQAVSTTGAPAARHSHNALWTGQEMVVLGGETASGTVASGGAYNPGTDQWRALTTAGNPQARSGAAAVWPSPTTLQFVQSPQQPLDTGSQWASWKRSASAASPLERLVGNAAYLVYSTSDFTWNLKGRPVLPHHEWTTTGLNFVGFPTVPVNPPSFEDFLLPFPELRQNAEIYQYPGGELGAGNPVRVFALRSTAVQRGQAYWIRSGNFFNRYYGPFRIVSSSGGVDFRDDLSAFSLRLRNLTPSNLVVTLQLAESEPSPAGQPSIAGAPPLLLRGSLNTTNLTHGYTNVPVGSPRTWTLAGKGLPGSEAEVVLGLNRAAITNDPGALLAGILRFTDSLGHSQVDVAMSGAAGSKAGLWVGGAMVTQVGQYLKSYQRNAADQPVVSADGQYVVTGVNTNLGAVPRFFPLRLIVHNPTNAAGAVLLQRAYVGLDAYTNAVVATQESVLGRAFLEDARRISATHLPWTEANPGWAFNGKLGLAATVTASVTTDFNDQASNPFLHTYHPDHDNRDATFQNALAQGSESHTIRRDITLAVSASADDFASLTAADQRLEGNYVETVQVQGLARAGGAYDTRQFEVRGLFSLTRINDVPILTTSP
ncbi:MAG: hypothetical protein HY674_12055 [Chloroflexi bacterium]|nr:hypothetical protein [Chloroflexota bacterium]